MSLLVMSPRSGSIDQHSHQTPLRVVLQQRKIHGNQPKDQNCRLIPGQRVENRSSKAQFPLSRQLASVTGANGCLTSQPSLTNNWTEQKKQKMTSGDTQIKCASLKRQAQQVQVDHRTLETHPRRSKEPWKPKEAKR